MDWNSEINNPDTLENNEMKPVIMSEMYLTFPLTFIVLLSLLEDYFFFTVKGMDEFIVYKDLQLLLSKVYLTYLKYIKRENNLRFKKNPTEESLPEEE